MREGEEKARGRHRLAKRVKKKRAKGENQNIGRKKEEEEKREID